MAAPVAILAVIAILLAGGSVYAANRYNQLRIPPLGVHGEPPAARNLKVRVVVPLMALMAIAVTALLTAGALTHNDAYIFLPLLGAAIWLLCLMYALDPERVRSDAAYKRYVQRRRPQDRR